MGKYKLSSIMFLSGDWMVVVNKSLNIDSGSKFQIIDITSDIINILNDISRDDAKIFNGIVNVFSKHSTHIFP